MNSTQLTSTRKGYLPDALKITDWNSLEPFFKELQEREVNSLPELMQWMYDRSELDTLVSEEFRWRYVNVTRNTDDKEANELLDYFYEHLEPKLKAAAFGLNKKLVESPFIGQVDKSRYGIYLRNVQTQIDIYRDENLPLFREMNSLEKQYANITGNMEIVHDGQTLTMPQAHKLLKDPNRELRETIYRKISEVRLEEAQKLDDLFDKLLKLRHQVAVNCGFDNYRDYKFVSMGRHDYSADDCLAFHQSVEEEIVPLAALLQEEHRQELGVEDMRPWDLEAEAPGNKPLQPFEAAADLIANSITALGKVDEGFGTLLANMDKRGFLDLESRKGKAPGGYNMTMPKTGLPFIFMNAAGTDRDLKTMVHEAGHAVHSLLSHPLEVLGLKQYPSEVAELASMSMELFTMADWGVFYDSEEELVRSKQNQLKGIIKILPWIATIDAFQHWLYTHPGRTQAERKAAWLQTMDRFSGGGVNWQGLEDAKAYSWQKQLHLYEVPFYYIEYGFAQLGAVAMWRQYLSHPVQAISNYKEALKLGYTKSIPEIYQTAGIEFRFDREYISNLAVFLKGEYEKLQ